MGRNYYEILGIEKDATPEEIRKAYIKLAKEWHPDVNKAAEAKDKFSDISEAFEILSHPTRRQIFDKHGEEGLTAGGKRTTTGPLRPGQCPGIPPNSGNRLAGQFFGYGIPGLHPSTGEPLGGNNIPSKMGIPGYDLNGFKGGKTVTQPNGVRTTTYTRPQGKGLLKPDKPPKKKKRQVLAELRCTLEELYNGCTKQAEWEAYEDGEQFTKVVDVEVEPGWMLGQKIDAEDENDAVTIIVTEAKHETYNKKKNDLYYTAKITLAQAIANEKIIVPTIEDGPNLELQFGGTVTSEYTHRVEGYGMPIHGTEDRGDMYVSFEVTLPKNLTHEQRKQIGTILAQAPEDSEESE